tara:strand:- start:251399 stop:252220 length:822 start_codon:yes stop_codon:yes gene_type:complete
MYKNKAYYLLLFLLVFVDLFTKTLAVTYLNAKGNPGIFLGHYAHSPILFRVISLSTLAGFLLLIYFILVYLLPANLTKLKYSITLLTGGVMGNVFDRVYRGVTIDFIPFNLFNYQYYFNFADVSLVMGAVLCSYLIFFDDKNIWFDQNSRKRFLINPREQLRLAFKFVFFSFMSCTILGIFSITYINSYLTTIQRSDMLFYVFIFLIVLVLICATVFLLGLIISHRSSGPLFAFEQYVDNLLKGEDYELNLREGDNYKHLEELARKLRKHLNK